MITYTDKVQVSVNPLAPEEQWRADDANEVKNEVNANIIATAAAQATADAAQTAAEVTAAINATIGTATQTALNLKSDSYFTYYTKTGSYTLLAADRTDVVAGKRLLFIMDSASAMNFTVPADATVDFPIGTEIKIIRIGVGVVTFVGAAPPTITGSAGDLVDSGSYSIMSLVKTASNAWTLQNGSSAGKYIDWTTTFGGFSVAPTGVITRYTLINKMCHCFMICGGDGTSSSTSFTCTLPLTPKYTETQLTSQSINSGIAANVPGQGVYIAGSTTFTIRRDTSGTTWTASGGKRANFNFSYEIQ